STATRLAGAYDFLYRYHNKDYSDNILGKEVFGSISFSVDLYITVMGPININKKLVVASDLSSYEIAFVPENTDPKSFTVIIDGLKSVYFRGTEQIDREIESLQKAEKDALTAQKKEEERKKAVATAKPGSGNSEKPVVAEQKNTTHPEAKGAKQVSQPRASLQTKNGKYYQTKNGVTTELSKQDYDRIAKEAEDN
ncbi:MAG: hypothetical protein K2X37_02245, partial [Chitinophagaceae bacterium]|nr:hypothetical protein [Chitinophagaceae bacterium]